MKESVKNLLKSAGIYHVLQSGYRQILFSIEREVIKIKFKKFKGSGFECNICGSTYTKFKNDLPAAENLKAIVENEVIAGYGNNIICPNCFSNARERLVIEMLKNEDLTGKKILHLSPEKNIFNFLKTKAEVTTADLLPGFYQHIDRQVQHEDAIKLSFGNQTFDMVIANHILEHIPDDEIAMREIYRVLKNEGSAILQVPYSIKNQTTLENKTIQDPALQSLLYGQNDHVRIYSLQDYICRLENAGFVVKIISAEQLAKYRKYAIQVKESFLLIRKISA